MGIDLEVKVGDTKLSMNTWGSKYHVTESGGGMKQTFTYSNFQNAYEHLCERHLDLIWEKRRAKN